MPGRSVSKALKKRYSLFSSHSNLILLLAFNSAEVHSIDLPKVRVLVYNDGRILWVPPAHFESFCKLDLRYWPVDKQTCKLKFGSWTSHGEDIELRLYDNNTEVKCFILR